ncbi:MtrAB system histidine kinase MtrB [Populibacterium corticicola]|uniref:Sensor histidine kinase MtrB n=1 Tax=Populibacterium corticicola TaxID=1812826 RepID=A0ABW5XD64_9MICO
MSSASSTFKPEVPAAFALVRAWRAVTRPFRTSLQFRVMFAAISIGVISLVLLTTFLSSYIRNGLVEQRVTEILEETARSVSQAQATMNASAATTQVQVQQTLTDIIPALQQGGTSGRDVYLWKALNSDTSMFLLDHSTAQEHAGLIDRALRETNVRGSNQQHYRFVEIREADGTSPGIVVGSTVEMPVGGKFEVYFLYSLAAQEQTLRYLQGIVGLAGIALVAILGALTFTVTRQVVIPVQQASAVAERIADGHLDERLAVLGEDEVARLAMSFNEMASSLGVQIDQLAELSKVQRRFVSDVSHELRTPLTTVRMASEMIYENREEFAPVVKRSAELLHTQIDRFEDLLADLLEISRFDAGAAVLSAEARDLNELVITAIDNVMPLAEKKGVWVSADLPEVRTKADFDSVRVERILRNLLVNAVEHAEGNPVHVTVRASETAVAVSVRDHGIGMDREQVTRVFDRFWRADPARARTTGGTGLGLSIAKEDAHLHGGWLEVWARPGFGSNFRLTLPVRAGITLVESPVELEPSRETPDTTEPVYYDHEDHGPAVLPSFDQDSAAIPTAPQTTGAFDD